MMDWSVAIREIMRQHNIGKVEALAVDLGVRPSTVYRWINGETRPSQAQARRLERLLGGRQDVALAGMIAYVDNSPMLLATLLDGAFNIVRTTRRHQSLSSYDPSDLYGRSCERYLGPDMERVLTALHGLKGYRERGIVQLDLKLEVIRQPGEPGYMANVRRFTRGSTFAIGDPRAPAGYLTTLELVEGGEPDPPRYRTLFGDDVALRL